MTSNRTAFVVDLIAAALSVCSFGCGGGSSFMSSSPPPSISVSLAPQTATVVAAGTARLTATVANDGSGKGVTWAVSCSIPQCGTISPLGQASATYTAPSSVPVGSSPTTITVTATAVADPSKSASAAIIPVGHITGYDLGVDYHAYGDSLDTSAFINEYNQPQVRQTVQAQLQGMADRGATLMHTRVWLVNNPGDNTDMGMSYREFFPLSDQEAANLRAYAQDVAAVQGASGNRLRLDICLLWLGAADYTIGSPTTGLGYFQNITALDYISRVATTTDKVLAAVRDVMRPDGVRVVDTLYLDGTEMIGPMPNQQWFLTANYPRFVSVVSATGIRPSVYFNGTGDQAELLDDTFTDPRTQFSTAIAQCTGYIEASILWFSRACRYPHASISDFI